MSFRIPMFLAAASLFVAGQARASSPANTDEVRAVVAGRTPRSAALSDGSAVVVGATTDEVRAAVAGRAPRSAALSDGSTVVLGATTDEIRAAFGREPARNVAGSNPLAGSGHRG